MANLELVFDTTRDLPLTLFRALLGLRFARAVGS